MPTEAGLNDSRLLGGKMAQATACDMPSVRPVAAIESDWDTQSPATRTADSNVIARLSAIR
jgi:hypothetical protein